MQKITFRRLLKGNYMNNLGPNYSLVTNNDLGEIRKILVDDGDGDLLFSLKQTIGKSLNKREIFLKNIGLARFIKIRIRVVTVFRSKDFKCRCEFEERVKLVTLYKKTWF